MGNDKVIAFTPYINTEDNGQTNPTTTNNTDNIITFSRMDTFRCTDFQMLSDEAYEWFESVIYGNKVFKRKWENFSGYPLRFGYHFSMYHKKGCPTYFNIYCYESKHSVTYELPCYEKIAHNTPDLALSLVKAGVHSYLKHTDPELCEYVFGF